MIDPTANESAHISVFEDLIEHSLQPRTSPELAIVTSLRRRYPEYALTVTPQSAGLVPFATAGKAEARLDKESETTLYWRQFEPAKGRAAAEPGHCRDKVIFGRYDYRW